MSDPNDELPQIISLITATEKICQIIAKARQYEIQIPPGAESPTTEGEEAETLFGFGDDAAGKGLTAAIEELSPEESIETVAITWVGRGDFTVEEWQQALTLAEERHTDHTATYLLGIPRLGDYLEEGLTLLGYSCDDVLT